MSQIRSNPKSPAGSAPHREEPEVTQEESVPTDGRNAEGERMMKDVRNSKLHDKGVAEHKTPDKSDTPAKP